MARIALEQIRIATPCDADWDEMTGDDRARFCGSCQKNVYNISDMTREEATDMVTQREGDICVRFYQRADETVLTADCEVGLAAVARRFKRLCGALLAFLGFFTITSAVESSGGGVSQSSPVRRMMSWTQSAQVFMGSCCLAPPPVVVIPVGTPGDTELETTDLETTKSTTADSNAGQVPENGNPASDVNTSE